MTGTKIPTTVLLTVLIIGSAGFAFALTPDLLSLDTEIFFGGSGNQKGQAIDVSGSNIFVAGFEGPGLSNQPGVLVRYDNPPSSTPNWSTTIGGGAPLFGVDATSDKVFVAGAFYPPTCGATDGVGGTEHKAGLAWFNPITGALIGCSSPNHFSYTGSESYQDVHVFGSSVYVVGASQGCGLTGLFTIAKYSVANPENGIITLKTDVDNGKPTCLGGGFSIATDITDFNGFLYAVGTSSFEAPTGTHNPILWKYDTNLNNIYRVRDATIPFGGLNGVTTFGGSIFAVGQTFTASSDYVIQKYAEDGTLLLSVTIGGTGSNVLSDVVGIPGDGLYAIGSTSSSGAGGNDAVILKIDPTNLDILSETLYGGSQDDFGRGIDSGSLFAVGESRSFTSGGNGAGQNDLVLLQYSTGIVDTTPPVITLSGANPQNLIVGDAYVELDATVTDNSGEIISPIIDSSAVDTSTTGTYSVTYDASDSSGNSATQVVRTVEVFTDIITTDTTGKIKLQPGDIVKISGATFSGNVKNDGGTIILQDGGTINGDIKTKKGGTITIDSSTVNGDIKTKKGGTITIDSSTVNGDIDGKDGTVSITDGSTIMGDVKSNKSPSVVITDSTVQGDVKVKKTQDVSITGTTVDGGNLNIKDSTLVTVTGNTVSGDLKIKNTSGSCSDLGNTVSGNFDGCP